AGRPRVAPTGDCPRRTALRDWTYPVLITQGGGMESESTYTRTKVLKRVGIGAAAAWSVPFLATSASASTGSVDGINSTCHANGGVTCVDCGFCGNPCATKNGMLCGCAPQVVGGKSNGCCACINNFFCSDSQPCNGNADCPRGWKCILNC